MVMTILTKEEIFTSAEAAVYLGLQTDTVRKLVQRELLKFRSQIGKSYIFEKSELDRYNREKMPPGNPEFQPKRKRRKAS